MLFRSSRASVRLDWRSYATSPFTPLTDTEIDGLATAEEGYGAFVHTPVALKV